MSDDELVIEGTRYVPSKEAAQKSGYSQDYIGQLARAGHIDARRIGGLWYVSIESLLQHKTSPGLSEKKGSEERASGEPESLVSLDGKNLVSASRAASLTGYTQDYVGQLARSGKILSKQVGSRWYVDREGIIKHKEEKDSLLAAVQSSSVGIMRPEMGNKRAEPNISNIQEPRLDEEMHFSYSKEEEVALVPLLQEKITESNEGENTTKESSGDDLAVSGEVNVIPIRIHKASEERNGDNKRESKQTLKIPRQFMVKGAIGLLVVFIVGGGVLLVSKSFVPGFELEKVAGFIERVLVKELIYIR